METMMRITSLNYRAHLSEMTEHKIQRIEKVLFSGYDFQYYFKQDNHRVLVIKTCFGDVETSITPFIIDNDVEFRGENIKTCLEHQRKGIATASYVLAEFLLQLTIVPDSTQTTASKALWAQLNRPFGYQNNSCP